MVSVNRITQCPYCHTKYQVPATLMGKSVQCKKCSKKFEVTDETTEGDLPPDPQAPKADGKTDSSQTPPEPEPSSPTSQSEPHVDSSAQKPLEPEATQEDPPDQKGEISAAPKPEMEQAAPKKSSLEMVRKIIRLALEFGFITESQNRELTSLPPDVLLGHGRYANGELMVEKGMIKKGQLDYLLFKNQMDVVAELDERFAKAARVNGYVTQAVIDQAFREQERLFNEDHRIVLVGGHSGGKTAP